MSQNYCRLAELIYNDKTSKYARFSILTHRANSKGNRLNAMAVFDKNCKDRLTPSPENFVFSPKRRCIVGLRYYARTCPCTHALP